MAVRATHTTLPLTLHPRAIPTPAEHLVWRRSVGVLARCCGRRSRVAVRGARSVCAARRCCGGRHVRQRDAGAHTLGCHSPAGAGLGRAEARRGPLSPRAAPSTHPPWGGWAAAPLYPCYWPLLGATAAPAAAAVPARPCSCASHVNQAYKGHCGDVRRLSTLHGPSREGKETRGGAREGQTA
ncbi:hypothetical protein E2C01_056367 [Portunus trituberculatus]|uniref:Uncharacterized protein n=1 Tax=Portunus trituberculatus TaxID=210409 RepID=A0A5B7GX67_PORTR|nr:hypothetical protein [Portunus trituberculatus]